MFYIVFLTILLLPVFSGIGKLVENITGRFYDGLSSKILLGIMCISIVWSALAFFFPVNLAIEAITITLGILSFFYFKIYEDFRRVLRKKWLELGILILIIAFFGSFYPFILDYFGYYVPSVKWISEIGMVKGISNLDLLLGQMSVWHIFQAGFSNFSDSFLRMNTILLIVYLIYIFEKKSWIHLVFFPILFLFSQSPSPDLPVIVFSLIILNEILLKNRNIDLLFIFSIFVFVIKPTMIWVPVLSFLYGIIILKKRPIFILYAVPLLLLFVFKNIWTFGFPIFPLQIGDLDLSWKPNFELLKMSSKIAVQKTYDMQFSYSEIQKFSVSEHIKNWLFLKGIKGKIHSAFILSLLAFLIYCIRKKSRIVWLIFFSVLIKSILVLPFSAQYRFFIDVFFVIAVVILFGRITKKTAATIFAVLSIFVFGFLSFPKSVKKVLPSFKLSSYMLGYNANQFIKPSVFELKKYKTHQIGNLKFNVVEGYPFSFDTPLPAISPEFLKEDFDAGIFPQMNSKELKDGFHWRKLTEDEKKQLAEIISEINPNYFNKPD